MEDKIKQFFRSLIEKAIYDLIRKVLLFIFTSGITYIITHIALAQNQYLSKYALVLAVSLSAGIGFVVINIFIRYQPSFEYRVLDKEYSYAYINKKQLVLTKRFRIRSLKNTCDRLYDRYNWTGSGKIELKSNNKGHKIIELPRRDTFQRYEVFFGRNLNIGQEIDVSITYNMDDPEEKSIPYLSTTVAEPTDRITLSVKVPVSYNIANAYAGEFTNMESSSSKTSQEMPFDRNGEIKWVIDKPKLNYVYSLYWDI